MRHLVEGLRGWLLGNWRVPAKSSLFRARQRLGSEPLRVLFATTAKPMATEATPGAFWRGLRLLAVDGTCWDVADSETNETAFGRPGSGRGSGRSAFSRKCEWQLWWRSAAMRCWTRNWPAAAPGSHSGGCLPRSTSPGQLVLADREFLGVPLWQAFDSPTRADLRPYRVLPVTKQFRDGSWLSHIRASSGPARQGAGCGPCPGLPAQGPGR